MQSTAPDAHHANSAVLWHIGGILSAAASVAGLCYHLKYIWVLCPQSLVVMFYRQSLRPYDSLGAADLPDLAVAAIYFPIVAWLLSRACNSGRFWHVARWIGIWHLVAIALAVGAAKYRNLAWSLYLGN